MNKQSKIKGLFIKLLLISIAIGMIFPMAWMLVISLKEFPEKYNSILELLFSPFSLSNYSDAMTSDSFTRYFINSTIVVFFVTAGNILFCFLVGYAFARREFRLKKALFATILGVLIIPPHVIMIPLYRLIVNFGWMNTYLAMIVPWLVTPFGIFLVKQYIESLPLEIENAARLDGAGNWSVIFRIVFPLCLPILTVVGIYTFISNWNSFLFPFIFTNDESMRTLPVGLAFYTGKQSIDWGHLMAGAAISALPILLIFLLLQKQIIKGLTSGALKE